MEKTVSAKVEGMTCGNCALTISRLLEKKGMTNVSANASSGEVNFTIADTQEVERVFDAIDDLGYKVVREGDSTNEHGGTGNGTMETRLLIFCALLTVPLLAHMFSDWHVLHNPWLQLGLATPVYAVGCYVFFPSAIRSLRHRMPNMDVLILLGATAAYVYSIIGLLFFASSAHQYIFFETTASIITLVLAGNWLEHHTVRSTSVAIDALVKLQPAVARLVLKDSIGKETILEVESRFVKKDDVVLVNSGDRIPVDGDIVWGNAAIDERMITGEGLPVEKGEGGAVVGGTLVRDGSIKVRATNVGHSSVLSGIIRMIREAQGAKPPLQRLADRISAIFVPAVLSIAILTLLVNYFVLDHSFGESMMRSIAVMVISCPCAMGLATPAAVAVGLGRAARNGILIKGGDTLSALKTVKNIVFDKTGTLTTGVLHIESFIAAGMDEAAFRSMVAGIEQHSSHPIAKSITAQWAGAESRQFTRITEVQGRGIEVEDELGISWRLGSKAWLHAAGTEDQDSDLYLYRGDQYMGSLKVGDTVRDDAAQTIRTLQDMGFNTILLSGDKIEKVAALAEILGIREFYGGQSPEQKNEKLTRLLESAPTAMVGDGINDAPALARATVGISLSESTQIAIQSASIILSNNKLSSLPRAIKLGVYTDQTIKQNLFWAFFYNVIAIPVAAAGLLSPTWGAGIMALSDVVLVLNSLRLGARRL
ncbi:MAG: cadmium-translocating P-type ATPase [Sphingobacteriales bacterium]|nr:MAG: cadmium-translocating P-type ATPase [Sphingobacteriales bacterium]